MSVAPNAINYGNQLPLGIEAKSQRRLFFPATGDTYNDTGSNIIRISLNYDGMLDTHLSYLKFDLTNNTVVGGGGAPVAGRLTRDLGQPEISRLVISSGGVVLEDIQNYNHLVAGVLAPCQYGTGNVAEAQMNRQCFKQLSSIAASVDFANNPNLANGGLGGAVSGSVKVYNEPLSTVDVNGSAHRGGADPDASNGQNTIARLATQTYTYKLHSGLLDNDKYLPLVLMNNGLDIEIHLAQGVDIGISDDAANTIAYSVQNVRYVAHLIDLQRDFYDMLRQTQQASGGVIQIAGQTFRNFTAPMLEAPVGEQTLNVPIRARSIKSVFFKASAAAATPRIYNLSGGSSLGITSYNLQIGATKYPPTAIQSNAITNKSEPYFELMKSFGKLGSTIHGNLLSNANYLPYTDPRENNADNAIGFSPYGIDLETFRAEIENGIDTSSRALPMSLQFHKGAATAVDTTVFIWCMIDTLFFINMDGSVSVSS